MLFWVRAPNVAGHSETHPSKTEAERADRHGSPDLAAKQAETGEQQRHAAADGAQHARGQFGIEPWRRR